MNGLAYQEFGFHLSINDASLAHGGFFDACTDNRDAKCHDSHRKGVDFDVNTGTRWWKDRRTGGIVTERTKENSDYLVEYHPDCIDAYGKSLNCKISHGPFDTPTVRRIILDNVAKNVGLEKIEEDTIHYRAKN